MSVDGNPSLGELLLETADLVIGRLFVEMPGEVVSQDSETLRIRVRPAIRAFRKDVNNDALIPVTLPDILDVPVIYPRGGGFRFTWPLDAGDTVFLRTCDRSIEEWRGGDSVPITPADPRRFSLSDVVAYPGGGPDAPVPASARASGALVLEGDDIRLGSSAALEAAIGPLVDARFAELAAAYNIHVHPDPVSGTSGPPTVLLDPFDSVAASKVKVE